MITNILMPKLGLVMKKGRIIKWYKQVGEPVNEGEPLFQITTEKVTIDVEAKGSGYLRVIYAIPGAIVPVSGLIGLLGDKDEPLPDIKPPVYEIDKSAAHPDKTESAVPYGKKNDVEIPSYPPLAKGGEGGFEEVKASPAAKRLAKEKGIALGGIKGTGPGGRITEADVNNYQPGSVMQESEPAVRTAQSGSSVVPATPYARKIAEERGITVGQVAQSAGDRKIYAQDVLDADGSGSGDGIPSTLRPLTDLRRAVAERMSYSARTVAPVTLGMEVVAEELIKLKDSMAVAYPSDKVTINDILVKLVAAALVKHPLANASLEENGIRIYGVVNMGIGVAIEGGLIVPAIADADKKSIIQISRESKDLIGRAKTGRLSYEELSRGTFTLTNLGAYGIDMFTPIINPPQSATLGVGRIVQKPWVIGDRVGVAKTMVLSLTFDHRVIDGAPAAQCLLTIKQNVENPYMVLGV